MMFPTLSEHYPRDATIRELLGAMFSMRPLPRYYKQVKSRFYLVMRQSPVIKVVNTGGKKATALEAVIRRQPVKIQQTEETYYVL
jgi:hypothetical protein